MAAKRKATNKSTIEAQKVAELIPMQEAVKCPEAPIIDLLKIIGFQMPFKSKAQMRAAFSGALRPDRFLLYKITNQINGKIYIGAHTGHPDDNYFGSGAFLKQAIKKYGKENFIKEIIAESQTESDLYLLEARVVNKEFLSRGNVYNILEGGRKSLKGRKCSPETIKRISDSHKGQKCWLKGKRHSEVTKQKIKEARRNQIIFHSIETRMKISAAQKGRKFPNRISHTTFSAGHVPWNTGKVLPYIPHPKKRGQVPWNKGKAGLQIAWNKGLKKNAIQK